MYRVVIADDEVLIRMYIREILENNGYEVVGEAEDGLDAIAVCRQKKPDFVIMDINMPVMTGLEATKVINEDKLAGFVIILTAYRDKERSRSITISREKLWRRSFTRRRKPWMIENI